MKLVSEQEIKTVKDWFEKAPPTGKERQWRDGKSAKELAKYITEAKGEMPGELAALIPNDLCGDGRFSWIAEHNTYLDPKVYGIGGGSRKHDMILFNDKILVGVEAKVDEELDQKLTFWLKATKGSESSKENRAKRLDAMCMCILGRRYDPEKDGTLRYQLFSALTGVILEAEKLNVGHAMLVIVVFKVSQNGRVNKNSSQEKDLKNFLEAVGYDEKTHRITSHSDKVSNLYVRYITIAR